MATIHERQQLQETGPAQSNEETSSALHHVPLLGRSVRLVGPWDSVEAAETPHEKNKRGELGKALHNWYFNRVSVDPLSRIAFPQSSADQRHTIPHVVAKAPKGKVNPQRVDVTDPRAMTRHIKEVARFLGADVVGITRVHPSMVYKGSRTPDDGTGMSQSTGGDSPDQLAQKYPYAIALALAWDYELGKAHRHHVGDHAYHFSQAKLHVIYANLTNYIRELGYGVVTMRAQPMPTALAAGIGELGRHGMLITERYGSRVHLNNPILTDLPLLPDKPIDIGVNDFCKVCRKCATACPTNSITMDNKVVHNGVEKYKINWETCYRLRAHVMDFWEICLTCVTACPYTKPRTWWHNLAVQTLKRTPHPLRYFAVRPLKFIDDVFWGRVPRKRVRWLHYDTGIPPVKHSPGEKGHNGTTTPVADPKGKVGYYYPLKENTRRFEIMQQREKKARSKVAG